LGSIREGRTNVVTEGFGEIAERLRRSTVQVSANHHGQGSGVIVRPDGIIVTNAHVTVSRPLTVQLWDGTSYSADLVSRDPGRDLALLRIPASGLPPAELGNSDQLWVGELVIAIGNPFGFIGALTTGVVHGLGRMAGLGAAKWIQSDVQLAPGNSGGPLADARGNVVGINTMVAGGLGLAVPSNSASKLLTGRAEQPPLGVVVRPLPMLVGGKRRLGMVVLEVLKDSAADAASLMIGDVLTGASGRTFNSVEDFERALDGTGERVIHLQFLRGDRSRPRMASARLGVSSPKAA
jgi:serine protease Do